MFIKINTAALARGRSRSRTPREDNMRIRKLTGLAAATALGLFLMTGARPDLSMTSTLTWVSPELSSIGAMAFGPENILFVGDSEGAGVYALDVADEARGSGHAVSMEGVGTKIAALLGTTADEIVINDLAVHPASQNIYLGITPTVFPKSISTPIKLKRSS